MLWGEISLFWTCGHDSQCIHAGESSCLFLSICTCLERIDRFYTRFSRSPVCFGGDQDVLDMLRKEPELVSGSVTSCCHVLVEISVF